MVRSSCFKWRKLLKKYYPYLLILFLACISCNKKYDEVVPYKNNFRYTAEAKMTVYGNKIHSEYQLKYYVMKADKFRIDCQEPGFLSGTVIINNEGVWSIRHKFDKAPVNMNLLLEEEDYLLLGIITNNILQHTRTGITMKTGMKLPISDDNQYYVWKGTTRINIYREIFMIYFDRKSKVPCKLECYDVQMKKRVELLFNHFFYVDEFDKEIFE